MTSEKELIRKESAAIYHFFDSVRSQVLSVSAIERLAEVPKNTLLNLLAANRTIPINHIVSLVRVLENFGYQTQWDWAWITSPNNPDRLTTNQDEEEAPKGIYFYFNYPTRKVTLHKGGCSFCRDGKGAQENIHGENNGGWRGKFETYQDAVTEAQVIAQEIGVDFTNCRRCSPQTTKAK